MCIRSPVLLVIFVALASRVAAAPLTNVTFVAFDLETTGFNARSDRIIEIGAVKFRNGETIATLSTFVAPGIPIPHGSQKIHGITDDMVRDAPTAGEALQLFFKFSEDAALLAHNAKFDLRFIAAAEQRSGHQPGERRTIDTLRLARKWWPDSKHHALSALSKQLDLSPDQSHRALADAQRVRMIFLAGIGKEAENVTVKDLSDH